MHAHGAVRPLYVGLYTKAHELPCIYMESYAVADEAPINRRHRAVFRAKSHHPMAFAARTLRPVPQRWAGFVVRSRRMISFGRCLQVE